MYKLDLQENFKRRFRKLTKKNNSLKIVILDVLEKITIDPYDSTLRTHKVTTRKLGVRWSSRVNGDLRIIWDFDENENLIILVLTIGGHSGKNKVYK